MQLQPPVPDLERPRPVPKCIGWYSAFLPIVQYTVEEYIHNACHHVSFGRPWITQEEADN